MRWYISAAAIRDYQSIAGYTLARDGESFDRAEFELAELAEDARLARDISDDQDYQTYRGKATIRGRRVRLEFSVNPFPRAEGDLPQLVAVRNKGGNRT